MNQTIAAPALPAQEPASNQHTAWTVSVVYEDDDIVIELATHSPAFDTLAVTFDPIMVDLRQPAYAGDFLRKAGVDTLAVRKKHEHFYQPLALERFLQLCGPYLRPYRRRLAYGSSLGAYAVLYYCQHGFDTVIASSPRVSAHPRFGGEPWQSTVTFQHAALDPENPASSGAVIFYDPHDPMDRRFVQQEVQPAWPRARLVPVPYAGHPANQFLAEVGFIAAFVRSVVTNTTPPVLNRRLKAKSGTYHQVLAAACLHRRKLNWSRALAERALQLSTRLTLAKRTLGEALLELGQLDEAEPLLREFAERNPLDGAVCIALRRLEARRAEAAEQEAQATEAWSDDLSETQAAGSVLGDWRRRLGHWLQQTDDGVAARGRRPALWLRRQILYRGAVTREDVLWCYRHFLGREPESENVITQHLLNTSFRQLTRTFTSSPEYARRLRVSAAAPPGAQAWHSLYRQEGPVIVVGANSQAPGLAAALRSLTRASEVIAIAASSLSDASLRKQIAQLAARADLWLASPGNQMLLDLYQQHKPRGAKLIILPPIHFSAFHPDACQAEHRQTHRRSRERYHSAIALWAHAHGLGVSDTVALFRAEIYRALGYFDARGPSERRLKRAFEASDLRSRHGEFMSQVRQLGCFMHTPDRPQVTVLAHLARLAAEQAGLPVHHSIAPGELTDDSAGVIWPVYPEIAEVMGLSTGSWVWKFVASHHCIDGVQDFVEHMFASYEAQGYAPGDLVHRRVNTQRLDQVLGSFVRKP